MRQIQITDLTDIRDLLQSRSVTTWGQGKIPDNDLYQLAIISPISKGDGRTQFVCSMDDLEKARAM